MKIGILYICTGKYIQFFNAFFKSSEAYFFKGHEINYFVFTDGNLDKFEKNKRIHRIAQEKLGWPYDTLMRFHMFSRVSDVLRSMDFLFFFNANMKFVRAVGTDILPNESEHWLVGVKHPYFFDKDSADFTYENNPESAAYISVEEGTFYYQGCLSGGRTFEYLKLSEKLSKNIDVDLSKDIVAVWHDESHLNRYFLDHKPKQLDSGYACPEEWNLPFEKKIVQISKDRLGGHDFLRGVSEKKQENQSFLKSFKAKINPFI